MRTPLHLCRTLAARLSDHRERLAFLLEQKPVSQDETPLEQTEPPPPPAQEPSRG